MTECLCFWSTIPLISGNIYIKNFDRKPFYSKFYLKITTSVLRCTSDKKMDYRKRTKMYSGNFYPSVTDWMEADLNVSFVIHHQIGVCMSFNISI